MLVRGDTETVGLVVSHTEILSYDGFVPALMYGISRANQKQGFHVLLEGLGSSGRNNPYEELVESRRIDGMIVLNPRADDRHLHALI